MQVSLLPCYRSARKWSRCLSLSVGPAGIQEWAADKPVVGCVLAELSVWRGDRYQARTYHTDNCGYCRGERHDGGRSWQASFHFIWSVQIFIMWTHPPVTCVVKVSISGTPSKEEPRKDQGRGGPQCGRQWKWVKQQVVTASGLVWAKTVPRDFVVAMVCTPRGKQSYAWIQQGFPSSSSLLGSIT